MKTHHHISLLFILLYSVAALAYGNPKDSTAVNQKTTTKIVRTDLANLEAEVRKLSGQNGTNGVGATFFVAPTTWNRT